MVRVGNPELSQEVMLARTVQTRNQDTNTRLMRNVSKIRTECRRTGLFNIEVNESSSDTNTHFNVAD